MNEVKMIIIMRKDLNMRKGKMVAQGSHAAVSLALYLERLGDHKAYKEWLETSFKKICVSVNSEAELLAILEKGEKVGLHNILITDAGHTEFGGVPTITCGAILGYASDLVEVTGKLPLL